MKFTDGYWMMKKNIDPLYAVEYESHTIEGYVLTVYAATRPQRQRGDTLNAGMITVRFSSPLPDVIGVSASHFEGVVDRGPDFQLYGVVGFKPQIIEEDSYIYFVSGGLTARICTLPGAWNVSFIRDGRELTNSGFRNLAYMTDRQSGKGYMVEQLALGVGEYIYGLGERFTPFVKNGQVVDMWNEDGGTASEIAYKNIPFYITNRNYGVFVDNPGDVSFEIASEKVERVQFSIEGEKISYYVISGCNPHQVMERYTALTGHPALPPAWSFGLWLTTSFTTSYDENTVTSFIQGMADRDIPLSVFHFDCFWMRQYHWCDFIWDPAVFPDPPAMLKRLKDRGLKICVWINPYIAQRSYLFEEGTAKGYLVRKSDGSVWQTDLWQAGMGLVDFTNPEAVKWYQEKLKALLDMGVDCFKTDFGERIPVRDIVYHDGSDPVRMHNYYTFLYNKAVFELLEKTRGEGEAVLFARSATAGGQMFPVHWGGDCMASYPSMAETLRGGLSLSACGFGFWSHDISGFESTATPDLYKRWCAFGLLSSHSRLHGSGSYRVPWNFDEEACDVLRFFTKLKNRLMPYIFGQAVKAHRTGVPVMRPMFMEFPEDPACAPLDLQYMLGDSLLVAPIFNDEGRVTYYLPKGTWENIITGEKVEGGSFVTEVHDYFSLPLMVRENTVLPVGTMEDQPDYDYANNLVLELYNIKDGAEIEVEIPDLTGDIAVTAKVVRNGSEIVVDVDKGTGWSVKYAGVTTKSTGKRVVLRAED